MDDIARRGRIALLICCHIKAIVDNVSKLKNFIKLMPFFSFNEKQ
jgi:hypothetical protein